MLVILAINLTTSCASQKISRQKDITQILSLEVDFTKEKYDFNEIAIADNFHNGKLISYLNKKSFLNNPRNEVVYNKIETKSLFQETNVKYFLNQLTDKSIKSFVEKKYLPIVLNFEEIKKEFNTSGNGNNMINFFTIPHLYLSIPVITQDGKYALIWYSDSIGGEGGEGIHLYKKIEDEWLLKKMDVFSIF